MQFAKNVSVITGVKPLKYCIDQARKLQRGEMLFLAPDLPQSSCEKTATTMPPGTALGLASTDVTICTAVAKAINPGAMLMIADPNTPQPTYMAMAKNLNPGAELYFGEFISPYILTATATVMNAGAAFVLHPKTTTIVAKNVAESLKAEAHILLHPGSPKSNFKVVAQFLHKGAQLFLHPETLPKKCQTAAHNMNPNALMLLPSAMNAKICKLIAKNMNKAAKLVPAPDMSIKQCEIIAKNMKPGSCLLPHPSMSVEQCGTLALFLNQGVGLGLHSLTSPAARAAVKQVMDHKNGSTAGSNRSYEDFMEQRQQSQAQTAHATNTPKLARKPKTKGGGTKKGALQFERGFLNMAKQGGSSSPDPQQKKEIPGLEAQSSNLQEKKPTLGESDAAQLKIASDTTAGTREMTTTIPLPSTALSAAKLPPPPLHAGGHSDSTTTDTSKTATEAELPSGNKIG